ncbi:Inner membrane protein YiaV precursor [Thalassoglobus neptunius]|uniref:Inner membrane protein YiaV n=1 Tax=Thalassoglobus neptunius TaxID=1938619 RepID=A0A5C5VMS1_9PLAN|nr:HlyD family efflux transporter periplasmic adaptor subunit [Thalassoglobus neptunius]TWT39828.1 Inner membrane protein YiaV precursor [Thalassoglobus neptunius]
MISASLSIRRPSGRIVRLFVNVIASVMILAIGGFTFFVFGQKPEIPKEPDRNGDGAALVRTVEVEQFDGQFEINLDGEASSFRVLTIGTEVEGRIIEKSDKARSGQFVSEGELLFQIDDLSYRLEVERIQAQLAQTDEEIRALNVDMDNQATLISLAEEDLELKRRNLQRVERLRQREATTDTDLDNERARELASRNQLRVLQNQLRAMTQQKQTKLASRNVIAATLKQAELDVERCRIVAPISGRIVDEIVEEGDHVQVGTDLVHISDGSRMIIRCQLEATELAWIWEQQTAGMSQADQTDPPTSIDPIRLKPVPCEVVYQFNGVETIWSGVLDRFEGAGLSKETRTFPCRVLVSDPEQTRVESLEGARLNFRIPTLLSGMYVTVRIPISVASSLMSVPIEAVRPGGKLWVSRDGQLQIHPVTVARTIEDRAIIRDLTSNLSVGDRIIVSPLAAVADAMPIREEPATGTASLDSESPAPNSDENSL